MRENIGHRPKKTFTLKEITGPSYAQDLASTKLRAFKDNNLNRAMYAMDEPEIHIPYLAERERLALVEGKSTVIAVIDNDNSNQNNNEGGKIVAYARWKIPAKYRPHNDELGRKNEEKSTKTGLLVVPGSKAEELNNPKYTEPPLPAGTNVPLVTEFRETLNYLRKTYWNEENEYLLGSLSTDPEYQGQGCASLLLDWGIKHADANGAAMFLEATPAAQSLYAKFGWEVVDTKYFDLAQFGGPNIIHRLTAMRREARTGCD